MIRTGGPKEGHDMSERRSLRPPPRAPGSPKVPVIPPASRKAQSIAPAVSKITISVHDTYLAMLQEEVIKRLVKYDDEMIDIGFEDRAYAGDLLRALQAYPKPGKAYLIKLPATSNFKSFEVEPLANDVFRITLKKT